MLRGGPIVILNLVLDHHSDLRNHGEGVCFITVWCEVLEMLELDAVWLQRLEDQTEEVVSVLGWLLFVVRLNQGCVRILHPCNEEIPLSVHCAVLVGLVLIISLVILFPFFDRFIEKFCDIFADAFSFALLLLLLERKSATFAVFL